MDVNLSAARTHLSGLVKKAVAGEDVVICRNGVPLVRPVPLVAMAARRGNRFPDMVVPDDAMAPLTEEEIDPFDN